MFVIDRHKACAGSLARGAGARTGFHAMRGVSLIEVLVSIVIASIGLLALAGVNAAAVRYTKMSQYRATAALLANEMGERIRANKGVATPVATGFYAGAYTFASTFAAQAAAPVLPAQLCDVAGVTCTEAQIAALDLGQWRVQVRNMLPEGSAYISTDGTEGVDMYVVWRDPAVAVGVTDETPTAANECINGLILGADTSIRCSYFRINL